MPNFLFRYYVVCPEIRRNTYRLLGQVLTQRLGDQNWFQTELSSTGSSPSTHRISSFIATPRLKNRLENNISSYPQITFYRVGLGSGLLQETSSASAVGSIGQAWTVTQVLADLGLQMIQPAP